MPIGISSKFERCVADAPLSLGYQSSGVAILRPSASVTTNSVAVNSTARGCKSPTSISKVLMPIRQQLVPVQPQMTQNITEFVRRESDVHSDAEVVEPEFGFPLARADMNVGGLAPLVGIEEGAIGPPS